MPQMAHVIYLIAQCLLYMFTMYYSSDLIRKYKYER